MTAAPKRRWLRYFLRTLFVVVTATVCFSWVGWNLYQIREREKLIEWARSTGVPVFEGQQPRMAQRPLPFIWRLLGARRVDAFGVNERLSDQDRQRIRSLFPESELVPFSKENISDSNRSSYIPDPAQYRSEK